MSGIRLCMLIKCNIKFTLNIFRLGAKFRHLIFVTKTNLGYLFLAQVVRSLELEPVTTVRHLQASATRPSPENINIQSVRKHFDMMNNTLFCIMYGNCGIDISNQSDGLDGPFEMVVENFDSSDIAVMICFILLVICNLAALVYVFLTKPRKRQALLNSLANMINRLRRPRTQRYQFPRPAYQMRPTSSPSFY